MRPLDRFPASVCHCLQQLHFFVQPPPWIFLTRSHDCDQMARLEQRYAECRSHMPLAVGLQLRLCPRVVLVIFYNIRFARPQHSYAFGSETSFIRRPAACTRSFPAVASGNLEHVSLVFHVDINAVGRLKILAHQPRGGLSDFVSVGNRAHCVVELGQESQTRLLSALCNLQTFLVSDLPGEHDKTLYPAGLVKIRG